MQVLTTTFLETVHESLAEFLPPGQTSACVYVTIDPGLDGDSVFSAFKDYVRSFIPLPEWITDDALELSARYECFAAVPSFLALEPGEEYVAIWRISWGAYEPFRLGEEPGAE